MVRTSVLFFPILIFFAISARSCSTFKWLFIGNLTDEEYSRHNLCYTKTCMLDADILIKAAALNASVDPCVDFKSFALGEFHYYRHLNDRYQHIGFQNDVTRNLFEKKRVALEQKQQENEPKVFRIMKQFFAKCRNSDYIRATVGDELISTLRRYVSSSQSSNSSWLTNDYTKVLFEYEPDTMLKFFLHQKLELCDDPRNKAKKIICLNGANIKNYENELPSILNRLKLNVKARQDIVKSYTSYFLKQQEIFDLLKYLKDNEIYKIKELPSRIPSENINWLKIINDNLFRRSQVTKDEEILITHPVMMQAMLNLLTESEPQLVADFFSAMFLLNNQRAFNIYQHASWIVADRGTIRGQQRFEECLEFIQNNLRPALLAVLAKKYYKKDLQKAAAEFAAEAVADYIFEMSFHEKINDEVKQKILDKLFTIKLWVAFPPNVLNQTMIDEFYDELELDGSESFAMTWKQKYEFGRKLSLERQPNPFEPFSDDEVVHYDFEQNILDIPLIYTVYPRFHPNRSRFFNMATFYMAIVGAVDIEVTKFVNKETNNLLPFVVQNANLAYKSYDRWLLDGGKELQLPGFKLTNRQMLWLAIANVYGLKIHKSSEEHQNLVAVLNNKYLHVHFKILPDFRKDFNCGVMTDAELELFQEFKQKLRDYYKRVQQS